MMQILDQLELNQTFFYQFVLFGLFFLVLSTIYLKPFQKHIQERNRKLKDDVQNASDLLRVVESRLSEYEYAISHSRHEAQLNYEKTVADARAKEDAALLRVKEELKQDYLKITQQLQEEKTKVESELKSQAAQLADVVAQKILGKM